MTQQFDKETDELHKIVLKVREANLTKQGLEHVLGVVIGYLQVDSTEKVEVLKGVVAGFLKPGGVERFMAGMKESDLRCYGEPDDD